MSNMMEVELDLAEKEIAAIKAVAKSEGQTVDEFIRSVTRELVGR